MPYKTVSAAEFLARQPEHVREAVAVRSSELIAEYQQHQSAREAAATGNSKKKAAAKPALRRHRRTASQSRRAC